MRIAAVALAGLTTSCSLAFQDRLPADYRFTGVKPACDEAPYLPLTDTGMALQSLIVGALYLNYPYVDLDTGEESIHPIAIPELIAAIPFAASAVLGHRGRARCKAALREYEGWVASGAPPPDLRGAPHDRAPPRAIPARRPTVGGEGAACYGNGTCDRGLRCEAGTCARRLDGIEGGACYGNGTCNAGLTCAADRCVRIPDGTDGGPCYGNGTCNDGLTCAADGRCRREAL